ncbi:uncharacterized protein LOC141714069 [Apium graveolens]|uniref:uncharacterized protein LOC141714069 n=1 Tax=Apium graveolens TaxID=4045 RepID=UPI003D78CE26
MGDENEAFYVVRKGDIVGLYKNSSDVQALLMYDPSITVFKGCSLPKETEAYLNSRGLKNSICSIGASAVQADLFGPLVVCPFQATIAGIINMLHCNLDVKYIEKLHPHGAGGSNPFSNPQQNQSRRENFLAVPPISSYCTSILEFDGASKGNPGQAGAGVVLRAANGSLVYRLREGLGIATNNVAEYRSLILGLKVALQKRITHISVKGDSKLVCMQIQGLWKTKNQNMADLCKVAKELKEKFTWFEIKHVEREWNSEADAQANLAVYLPEGEIQEDCERK